MNIIITAGGNQTRFGSSVEEQPKVLYPIGGGVTILSNIFNQLDSIALDNIFVCPDEKKIISDYVRKIAPSYRNKIIVVEEIFGNVINILPWAAKHAPFTIILGDTYFPENELTQYVNATQRGAKKYDGFVGITEYPVGDARVVRRADELIDLSHDFEEGFYCCGLFTAFDEGVFSKLKPQSKYAHTWAELPEKGYKIGYRVMGDGLHELDTAEEAQKLDAYLLSK